jgi:hypothetical protein
VATLPVSGSALLELAEPDAAPTELFCHDSHGGRRIIDRFVDVGGKAPAGDRDLL